MIVSLRYLSPRLNSTHSTKEFLLVFGFRSTIYYNADTLSDSYYLYFTIDVLCFPKYGFQRQQQHQYLSNNHGTIFTR